MATGDLPCLELQTTVSKAIQAEWKYLLNTMKSSIWKVSKQRLYEVEKGVRLALQAYYGGVHKVSISYLLQHYLFGNNYSKVQQYKIYKPATIFIFHIALLEKTKEIFIIAGLWGTDLVIKNNMNNNNNNKV